MGDIRSAGDGATASSIRLGARSPLVGRSTMIGGCGGCEVGLDVMVAGGGKAVRGGLYGMVRIEHTLVE